MRLAYGRFAPLNYFFLGVSSWFNGWVLQLPNVTVQTNFVTDLPKQTSILCLCFIFGVIMLSFLTHVQFAVHAAGFLLALLQIVC